MTDRTVVVKLIANVADFRRNMTEAAQTAKKTGADFEKFTKKNRQDMETVGKAGLAMGTGLALGVGLALKRFADFDQAMSNIKAATHESAQAMTQLREAALEAGERTAFSAVEAADGIEALAKAGVSTAAILNGGLNGALDLAAAGGLAVGDAAEIAATALTQFRLEGAQVPHVADLLAAAAGKAQGDVSDMGMALKQAGLVASQTGLSIEETTAGLASFASAGLLGSDAGTSFKSMLQRLTPQSEEAAGEMERLGISAYDAQGNFIGLEAFAGNLQDSLADLTVEQRNSAMATIFGSDAVRAASVLYSQGADGIAEWTEKVNDSGYAQETAAIKLDNLKGDIEAFMGSLETAFIKTGAAGDGFARGVVQQATDVVNAYNNLPQSAQSATMAVGSISAAASLAAGGFLLLAPRIVETREALDRLKDQMPRTTAAMGALGKAAGIAAALAATAIAVDQLSGALAGTPPGVNALTDSLADFIRTGEVSGDLAKVVGKDFRELADSLDMASKNRLLEFLNPFGESDTLIKKSREEIEALDQALASLVNSGNGVKAARFLMDAGISAEDAEKQFTAYAEAQAGTSAQTKLTAESQETLADAVVGTTGAVVAQDEALSDLMGKVKGLSDLILGLRGDERSFQAAVDEATASLKENGKTLDINTEKGRSNEAALDAIASSAGAVLQSMADAGKPVSEITDKFGQQRDALVKAAIGFGMTKTGAEAYADSVLRIPDKKTTAVVLTGADAALSQVERLRQHLAGLKNKAISVRVDQVLGVTVSRGGAGRVTERADGGYISGPGTGTSDSIPALLSNGEYVIRASSVAKVGRATLDRINRYADGGPVGFAAGGSVTGGLPLPVAAARLTSVEQVRALVQAWEDHNRQLEQAARRQELFNDLAQAMADRKVARGREQVARTEREILDARKALAEFDSDARVDAERRAVEALVDRLEDEAEAREKVAKAAQELAEARREATQEAHAEAEQALSNLNRLLDQEAAVRGRMAKSVRDFHAAQDAVRSRQVEVQAQFDAQQSQLRNAQTQAEREHLERITQLAEDFTDEQTRILADRRDALANATALDQAIDFRRGLPTDWLIRNAQRQVEALAEWMDELDLARRMGVSEAVIEALGLDEGPQTLAQVRALTRASAEEIDELNRTVEDRTRLAGEQVRREQVGNYGQLGQQLVAAQEQYAAAVLAAQADYRAGQERFAQDLLALQEDLNRSQQALAEELEQMQQEFLAEQKSLAEELAAIGEEQGRSFGEALAEGLRSQIPAVLEAAKALAEAMAARDAAAKAANESIGVGNGPGRVRDATAAAKKAAPGVAAPGAPPLGTAGSFMLNGQLVHVNKSGIIDTPGNWYGKYPMQVKTFDSGGWLQPGLTLAYNGTGQPERVLTAGQAAGRTVNLNVDGVTIRETVDVDLLAHRAEFLIAAGSMG